MTLFFLKLFGALLARLPVPIIKGMAAFGGEFIFLVARRRRRLVLSNLSHAFPGRDPNWIVATGRKSIHNMVEFALLAAAIPSCGESRLRKIFTLSPESTRLVLEKSAANRPVVVLGPHLGPQEGLCLLPLLVPGIPPLGGIYRPLNNEVVDQWIRESRERFGMRLFSRKRGLQEALRMLKAKEWLGLLFDQNSSGQGALITFLDRVASVTELPGVLVEKHHTEVIFLHAVRHGFWQIEICAESGPETNDRHEINFSVHRWLEQLLRDREKLLPTWLWAHNRWRHQRVPQLSLREKKNLLEKQNAFLGRSCLPRTERFFIRLPDRLRDVVMFLPLLRATRQSRPDAAFTVIGRADLLPLVQKLGLCEQAIPLPPAGPGYYPFFWRLRQRFPSAQILLVDSFRTDLESWLMGAPHRFGILRSGKRRPLLNRLWPIPNELNTTAISQVEIWEAFFRAQQLEGPLDFTPFPQLARADRPGSTQTIGLFCGAENSSTNWPMQRWRDLISQLLARNSGISIKVLGPTAEHPTAAQITEGFNEKRVVNLTGQTTLIELIDHLVDCQVVVGPNSGGVHLANALSIPVVAIGESDGERDTPVFSTPKRMLYPPSKGMTAGEIPVSQVLNAIQIAEVRA